MTDSKPTAFSDIPITEPEIVEPASAERPKHYTGIGLRYIDLDDLSGCLVVLDDQDAADFLLDHDLEHVRDGSVGRYDERLAWAEGLNAIFQQAALDPRSGLGLAQKAHRRPAPFAGVDAIDILKTTRRAVRHSVFLVRRRRGCDTRVRLVTVETIRPRSRYHQN